MLTFMVEAEASDVIRAELRQARTQFRKQALLDPSVEALAEAWNMYARIVELEDKMDGGHEPHAPELIELRKRINGQPYDVAKAQSAESMFRMHINVSRIGIGFTSISSELSIGERLGAREFCIEMLSPRK